MLKENCTLWKENPFLNDIFQFPSNFITIWYIFTFKFGNIPILTQIFWDYITFVSKSVQLVLRNKLCSTGIKYTNETMSKRLSNPFSHTLGSSVLNYIEKITSLNTCKKIKGIKNDSMNDHK